MPSAPLTKLCRGFGFLTLMLAPAVQAALLQGQVTGSAEQPLAGAIVTLFDASGLNSESVYTDAQGHFHLQTALTGPLTLRVRAPDYLDFRQSLNFTPETALDLATPGIRLQPADALTRSTHLPASAHASRITFEQNEDTIAFRSQCHYCHQIGNQTTRRARSEQEWQAAFERMESYGALVTHANKEAILKQLHQTFDGQPIDAQQQWQSAPELGQALYKEWSVGNAASYIHDIDVGPDGQLYGVDMSNDKIYVLNPGNGQIKTFDFPESELPLGGLFAGALAPLGTFNARHGPHSIQSGPDGRLWTTNSLATEIMSFDPVSHEFKRFPIGEDAIYPHTLRFDEQGMLWFTLALSNQIGRFNPATAKFTLIDTPSNGLFRWITDAFLPGMLKVAAWFPKKDLQLTFSHHKMSGEGYKIFNLPYGIDINPLDGSIWYSKLYSSYIGRVDPQTLTVEEIPSPLRGPRRMRFDRSGLLWIPAFEENALLRFDPKTKEFKTYPLPNLSAKEYDTPYALAVHPKTQDIWITSNLSDRIFRFIPKQERFIAYPSPTRVTFLREIVFLEDGGVCSSNSNLPATAIEGGLPKILCLYPGE
jgi:streptogramin lyase